MDEFAEIVVNTNKIPWKDAADLPGAQIKALGDGTPVNTPAMLLRAPANWEMPAHSHLCTEHHYILEGEYESDGRIFSAGAYRFTPAGTAHGTFHTKYGVTLLLVREPQPGS